MPKIIFNVRSVTAIKPPHKGQIDYWDISTTGLVLRVSAGGKKSWAIIYRNTEGTRKRYSLGTYPSMKVSDARQKAIDQFGRISKGSDPANEKKAERKAGTFSELADMYLEKYAKGESYSKWELNGSIGPAPEPNKRSWASDKEKIDHDLKPAWRSRKANAITRTDVNRILNSILDRGSPILANRVLSLIRKIYSWGISTDRVAIDVNPCHEIKKPAKENKRDRVLDDIEIKTFWLTKESVKMSDSIRIALQLALTTVQRPGEVIGLNWAELDTDWETNRGAFWTIPSKRTQNKKMHRVPLSPLAVDLLKQAKKNSKGSSFVFPSPVSNKPIRESSFSHALKRSRCFGLNHFTPHDLRRTAITHMGKKYCKVSRFTRDRIINHIDQTVSEKHYDLYEYDEEKRHGLNAWASRLEQVTEGKTQNSKVVPILYSPFHAVPNSRV